MEYCIAAAALAISAAELLQQHIAKAIGCECVTGTV